MEASLHALESASGPLVGGVERHAAEARESMRQARAGNWQLFEQSLITEGARHAQAGVPLLAWYRVANRFRDKFMARAVATYCTEPDRLIQLLLVLTEYVERSQSIIGREYYAVTENREREVAARHRRLLDAAPDAVIELDDRGTVSEWNGAAERTFGYTRADAIGRPVAELIIPERDRERHEAGVRRMLATGEQRVPGKRRELVAVRADGVELPIELTLVATGRLDGGRSIIGYLRDLSDQQHADESMALRDHALEQAEFGVVVSNPVTRQIINVNPAYARIVGYEVSELIGTSGERLTLPGSQSAIDEVVRQIRERGHHTYELRLLRKDGTTVPVLVSSSTVKTRSSAELRISSVIDVSRRVELEQSRAAAQAALQRSAARLEILASTGHEFAAVASDLDVLLGLVARRLSEIIGEGCAVRLIGDDGQWLETTSYYHPDPEIQHNMRAVLDRVKQRVGDGLSGSVAASGTSLLIPVMTSDDMLPLAPSAFQPILDRMGITSALAVPLRSRGRTVGVISLLRSTPGNPYTSDDQLLAQDLADRAGLAIDNAALVATLEQRVSQRTAALEAANRELEAFSYSVSHDLRTPLRAIDGFSRILMSEYEKVLDDRGRHYLQRVRSGTQRMAGLIDDLLNLARITRTSLDLATHDLSALAADVVSELQKREPGRAVVVHIAPGISARADGGLVRAALENLLGNAWKFTAKHDAAQIWFGADDGTFYVRDTGAGFDMAFVEKLFMPFQRLHAVREYEGTGIGLATVHRIVTRHGGRIWAEAAVGQGATFFFTLGDSHGRTA